MDVDLPLGENNFTDLSVFEAVQSITNMQTTPEASSSITAEQPLTFEQDDTIDIALIATDGLTPTAFYYRHIPYPCASVSREADERLKNWFICTAIAGGPCPQGGETGLCLEELLQHMDALYTYEGYAQQLGWDEERSEVQAFLEAVRVR